MFTKKNQPLVVAGAVLVIACTILATLVSLQGSRLRHIEYFGTLYDYSAVLHYNSALKQSSTLKISTIPSVRTNAQIKGDTIVLSFDEPVLSNQKYLSLIHI